MAKRYTRKSLKKPDEFVSFWHRAYEAARPYGRAIGYTLLGGMVVLIAGWTIDYLTSSGRQDATETFGRATRIAEAELITDGNPAKPDVDKVPRFKTEKDRAEAAIAEIDKLEKEHGSSEVARRAQLFKAGLMYDLGRYADAEAAWKKFADKSQPDDPLLFLAREGIGLSQESQNKLDEALATYKQLEPKAGDFYRDRALYAQARVLTKKGDKKGAEAAYRDLLTKVPQSPLRDEVQAKLGVAGPGVPPVPPVGG
jgi:predicted negative regulator of RcsB-dependent stress response